MRDLFRDAIQKPVIYVEFERPTAEGPIKVVKVVEIRSFEEWVAIVLQYCKGSCR